MKTNTKTKPHKTAASTRAAADPAPAPTPPPGKAAHVKVDLRNKNNADAVLLAQTVMTHMDNNPSFPTPLPADVDVQTAIDTLVAGMAAADAARRASVMATATMATARTALDTLLSLRGTYVDLTANGDPNVILSSGFQLRATPAPVGDLDAPMNVNVELNGTAGLMLLNWDPVTDARAYNIQLSPASTMERNWTSLTPTSTAKLKLGNMTLGQTYAFRVAAVGGASGQSLWSTEAVRMAA